MPIKEETVIIGGYEKAESEELTDELMEIWNNASKSLGNGDEDGILDKLKPIRLIATQIVAGTNYKFEAIDTESEKSNTKEVVIYKDLDGNCSVMKIENLE